MEQYNCHRCNTTLLVGEVSNEEYFAFCPTCDEDMYKFECIKQLSEDMTIKEKAEVQMGKVFQNRFVNLEEKKLFLKAMVEFATQMCKEQIKECANHYKAEYNYLTQQYTDGTAKFAGTQQSILNTPNVCQI